jgi:hypothetical protein
MATELRIPGVGITNPAIPSNAAFTPSLGVAGYHERRKASEFAALADGTALPGGWLDQISMVRTDKAGTPKKATVFGRTYVNLFDAAQSGFTVANGPAAATILLVFFGHHAAGGAASGYHLRSASGRQLIRGADRWKLQTRVGTDTNSLSIPFTSVPYVNDALVIAAITLSATGATDALRIVQAGYDQAVAGPVTKDADISQRWGKFSAGNTFLGPGVLEDITFRDRLLTSTELDTAIANLKAQYGIV